MAPNDLLEAFKGIGLSEAKVKETLKNTNLSKNLEEAIAMAKKTNPNLSIAQGMLLYHIASKIKPQIKQHMEYLCSAVACCKLDNELRVNAALEFVLQHANVKEIDSLSFDQACGVGIEVTPEEIEKEVEQVLNANKAAILEKRYRFPVGQLMGQVRQKLPWADGKAIKHEFDVQVLDMLGQKTEADLAPPPKKEKKKVEKTGDNKKNVKKDNEANDTNTTTNGGDTGDNENEGAATISELMKNKVHFHKPGENYKTDGYVINDTTMDRLENHLKRTKGQVRTRFPPEPNGILHIGHAKAININFGYAAAHNGITFLRYDDTNPEKEEEKFFTGIKDIVHWLGYQPYQITHSSDNFDQLYAWAVDLIHQDLAYVCHQKQEDIRGFNPPPSPWRTRPKSESLQLFQDMKNGKFEEGEATLRLKLTLEEGKQDPVAYRIKYAAHHRTGDKWCIYPTYDYTHCLCDSLEDITHSLCTKEFQTRRSSYYWLCNAVNAYCPVQWEYGRLNMSYTVVSKRKIAKLISSGICADWDDPRLFTLTALRRRGFPAEAINNFCARMGVTGAQMVIDPSVLEAVVRSTLNTTAPRTMVVLNPLKVNLKRSGAFAKRNISVPDFPDAPEKGSHLIGFDEVIFIEKDDFMEVGEKGYRRLTKDQPVGLRYAGCVLKCLKVVKKEEATGEPIEIDVEAVAVEDCESKPKAFIHWVAQADSVEIEVRLYERLFKHKNPEDLSLVPEGFLSDINENSLSVLKNARADKYLPSNAKVFDKYQFERIGFFSVDPDTNINAGKCVFNRTVSLKEDAKAKK